MTIAGPGFLNITLDPGAAGALAGQILTAGAAYGRSATLAGKRINLEFVSANPTGPVHIGGARWAAVGDALGRVLSAQGAEVVREYYFNDAGAQIDRFARSLLAAARGEQAPEDGYSGAYIAEIAARITSENPVLPTLPDAQAVEGFRSAGVSLMFEDIKATLHTLRHRFRRLLPRGLAARLGRGLDSGAAAQGIGSSLRQGRGVVAPVHRARRRQGPRRDQVRWRARLHRSRSRLLLDKRSRGSICASTCSARTTTATPPGSRLRRRRSTTTRGVVEVLIGQMVNLVRDGEPIRMSKRAGTVISLDDLIDALGVDAARFALIRYSVDTTLDLDIELWTRSSNDNPVFYVQYAHARLCRMLANAADLGLDVATDGAAATAYDPSLLDTAAESELLALLAAYPGVLASSAELREPHRVARYLEDLAAGLHRFYDHVRVLPMGDAAPTPATTARLRLSAATRTVLASGLGVLGVSAPERM